MGNAVSSLRNARKSLIFRNFFEWYKMKVKYALASTMISSLVTCFFFDAIIFDGTGTPVLNNNTIKCIVLLLKNV